MLDSKFVTKRRCKEIYLISPLITNKRRNDPEKPRSFDVDFDFKKWMGIYWKF